MTEYNKKSENTADSPQNTVNAAQDAQSASEGKRENPFSAYAAASQIGFMVIVPLLIFIWGGSWLVEKFSLPQWLIVVFIALGILTMISSVGSYLMKLARKYGKSETPKVSELHHDTRDHDYYGD